MLKFSYSKELQIGFILYSKTPIISTHKKHIQGFISLVNNSILVSLCCVICINCIKWIVLGWIGLDRVEKG